MTTDRPSIPFLVRFGQVIAAPTNPPAIAYDAMRQEGLVRELGVWVPALDAASTPSQPQTLTTEVKSETTDNQ
jgi:hypothetical protein